MTPKHLSHGCGGGPAAVTKPVAVEPAHDSTLATPVRTRSAVPVRESGVSMVVAVAAAAAAAESGSLNPQPVDGARRITSKLKSK
ncbi:Os07g0244150 [Oryza sativa Japonica Group]|nr:Os07g0244150 [Oryza sativa Japonica Group]